MWSGPPWQKRIHALLARGRGTGFAPGRQQQSRDYHKGVTNMLEVPTPWPSPTIQYKQGRGGGALHWSPPPQNPCSASGKGVRVSYNLLCRFARTQAPLSMQSHQNVLFLPPPPFEGRTVTHWYGICLALRSHVPCTAIPVQGPPLEVDVNAHNLRRSGRVPP